MECQFIEVLILNRHILYSIENILEMLPKIIVELYDKLKFIILTRGIKILSISVSVLSTSVKIVCWNIIKIRGIIILL